MTLCYMTCVDIESLGSYNLNEYSGKQDVSNNKVFKNLDDVINCRLGRLENRHVVEKRWSYDKIIININRQAPHMEKKNEIHKWDSTFYLLHYTMKKQLTSPTAM